MSYMETLQASWSSHLSAAQMLIEKKQTSPQMLKAGQKISS